MTPEEGGTTMLKETPATNEEFAESVAKLHELINRPGVDTVIVFVGDEKSIGVGCAGKPINVTMLLTAGGDQLINLIKRAVQNAAG